VDCTKDYYNILQITPAETFSGIHRAYRRLAKQHHPDHAGVEGAAAFRAIQEAYQVLSHPEEKRQYDRTRHARRVEIRAAAEPIVSSDPDDVVPEPFASPFGMKGDGSRVLRQACRTELIDFCRIAEILLSPLLLRSPLTEDEVYFVRLYLRELTDRYGL
jgi:DnaJ-class molecular chaperone